MCTSPILHFWHILLQMRRFSAHAKLQGQGLIHVEIKDTSTILFHEKGTWDSPTISFSNTYLWKLNRKKEIISLEHLRFEGAHLAHFKTTAPKTLTPIKPHTCANDLYTPTIKWTDQSIELNWIIRGPKKSEEIKVWYRR